MIALCSKGSRELLAFFTSHLVDEARSGKEDFGGVARGVETDHLFLRKGAGKFRILSNGISLFLSSREGTVLGFHNQ